MKITLLILNHICHHWTSPTVFKSISVENFLASLVDDTANFLLQQNFRVSYSNCTLDMAGLQAFCNDTVDKTNVN